MPERSSWVPVAPDCDWSLQNLPYGIFSTKEDSKPRVGVAIGDSIVDLAALQDAGLLSGQLLGAATCFRQASARGEWGALWESLMCSPTLNAFMQLGLPVWEETRDILTRLLASEEGALRDSTAKRRSCLVAQRDATMHVPAQIPNYTDFYASREHASAVGTMFRGPENALQPNWLHLPVGYHGRASSIVCSGTPVRRPWGQVRAPGADTPLWQPSAAVDFELEMGFFMGPANVFGAPLSLEKANDAIFGYVLVNDWSARDLQAWEYVPLGPFTSKNWATSISPWVVSSAALAPFRVAAPHQSPMPPAYLRSSPEELYNYGIELEVDIVTSRQVAGGERAVADAVTRTRMDTLYWTPAQMAAHHTVSGCLLLPGDLLASGTISSEGPMGAGCLLEATRNGKQRIPLPNAGASRAWLEDGDTVVMRGHCQGDGYRVGFGECRAKLLPALDIACL